ncbi:hypothetical protein L1987_03396 [Smallanthus sonchifolius]|uniref:Uncharacterized protein n=1 Tax=Smallanthus sonchifolius TaxID=185202 RepID=A0ACB9KAF6_9ASTR|nr:hypothetical protein L1987_03396 [Smallanthus sonchifolius]
MAMLPVPAVLLFHILICYRSLAVIAQSSHRHLIDEIREAELKIVRLESVLEESIWKVDSKNMYIKESEKLIKEITSEFDHLQSVLLTMKNYSSCANERFNRLEEEVRLLWVTARKNNFELHNLESIAQDAENSLEVTKSRVEMMTAIVNEQWIQIQHLDQAFVIVEKEIKEVKRQVSRCSFLKFVKRQFGNILDDCWEALETTWSTIKQNHHRLQQFVKKEMQKWEYTATFANKEEVFFVASALIIFPALSLGVFLLNNFF